MADMTLCVSKKCKDKDTCRRQLVKADELYQSYFDPSDGDKKEMDKNKCNHYIEARRYEIKKEVGKNENIR